MEQRISLITGCNRDPELNTYVPESVSEWFSVSTPIARSTPNLYFRPPAGGVLTSKQKSTPSTIKHLGMP